MGEPERIAAADSKAAIDTGPMGFRQWLAVAIIVGLNALDGFDVLSISFASPGIMREWGMSQSIFACLSAMMLGMYGAGQVGGVEELLA